MQDSHMIISYWEHSVKPLNKTLWDQLILVQFYCYKEVVLCKR